MSPRRHPTIGDHLAAALQHAADAPRTGDMVDVRMPDGRTRRRRVLAHSHLSVGAFTLETPGGVYGSSHASLRLEVRGLRGLHPARQRADGSWYVDASATGVS